MSREDRFINRAVGVALTSQCRWRHGAILTKGSKVIAFSPNTRRNNPEIDHKNATYHAEEGVFREMARVLGTSYLGCQDLSGYSLWVARVNIKNEPSLSRPCANCWDLIAWYGLNGAYYTNEFGDLSHETRT